jgi:hypothetical protein
LALSRPTIEWCTLARQAYRMLDQWCALLADDVADAGRVLHELLDGALRLTPIDEPTRRGYRSRVR